jgi:hypothetical protein
MNDVTTRAVSRQLEAMDCKRYEIGIRHPQKGMLIKMYKNASQVLGAVGWFKHKNAIGEDIYIRPARDVATSLVLIDDLDLATVRTLTDLGLQPTLVTETSAGNFQAWVRLSPDVQMPVIRTLVAERLAWELAADAKSAHFAHFGRLAGFTNCKPSRAVNGRSPFVLIHAVTPGALIARGAELIALANARLREIVRMSGVVHEIVASLPVAPVASGPNDSPGRNVDERWCRLLYERLRQRFAAAFDASRADWMVALELLRQGYSRQPIASAILQCSPDITTRKGRGAEDYLTRTINKAEIWNELRAQGHAWDGVKDDLLDLTRRRTADRGTASS